MAIVIKNSTALANQYAIPEIQNPAQLVRADMFSAVGAVTATNGDSAGSTYWFCEIPSSSRLIIPVLRWDGGSTNFAFNLGLYTSNQGGTGIAVNATLFGTAIKPAAGPQVNLMYNWVALNDQLPIWQLLGLTADPIVKYAVVATVTTACDFTQTMSFQAVISNNI